MSSDPETLTPSLLHALGSVLSQVAEPTHVLKTVLDQCVTASGADRGVFVEITTGGAFKFKVLHQFETKDFRGETGRYSKGIFQSVIDNCEPVLIEDARQDSLWRSSDSVVAFRMVSILCMPLFAGERLAALVHLESNRPGHFNTGHQALLESLLEVVGPVFDALEEGRKVLEERDSLRDSESGLKEETRESRKVLAKEWSFSRFAGRAPALHNLQKSLMRVARSSFPVLLLGESGTGKSILARAIHGASPRSSAPFITVFCPSLEKGMVEADLFGHKKGSFTGALSDRVGKLQAAEKGTLFLDEIGELPLEIQPKLLRLLQEKTYERVGDPQERKCDVRIITATNRDLELEVEEGRFRRDLYERLNFVPLEVPPLRDRREDIPLLLRHCLDRLDGGRWIEVTPEGLDYLRDLEYAWPGNVRELEQLSARIVLDGEESVGVRELQKHLRVDASRPKAGAGSMPSGASSSAPGETPGVSSASESISIGLPELLEQAEKSWLEEALRRYPRLTRAELAEKLKISQSALYNKLAQHGLK